MAKREIRCSSCNKLLMKDAEIKCPRCKVIVVVGEPCEHFEGCSHRMERTRYGTIKNLLNTLPIGMKEKMRLSSYKPVRTAAD